MGSLGHVGAHLYLPQFGALGNTLKTVLQPLAVTHNAMERSLVHIHWKFFEAINFDPVFCMLWAFGVMFGHI